jgi:hypothetical protein
MIGFNASVESTIALVVINTLLSYGTKRGDGSILFVLVRCACAQITAAIIECISIDVIGCKLVRVDKPKDESMKDFTILISTRYRNKFRMFLSARNLLPRPK